MIPSPSSTLLATTIGRFNGIGELGNTLASPSKIFTDTVSKIVGVLTVAGGIWFIIQIVLAALSWISSGSDKQALDNAKKKITNAVIGLGLVVFAYTFIGLVGLFLGFDILGLQSLILSLGP